MIEKINQIEGIEEYLQYASISDFSAAAALRAVQGYTGEKIIGIEPYYYSDRDTTFAEIFSSASNGYYFFGEIAIMILDRGTTSGISQLQWSSPPSNTTSFLLQTGTEFNLNELYKFKIGLVTTGSIICASWDGDAFFYANGWRVSTDG